jgi:hypothetical protein
MTMSFQSDQLIARCLLSEKQNRRQNNFGGLAVPPSGGIHDFASPPRGGFAFSVHLHYSHPHEATNTSAELFLLPQKWDFGQNCESM